MFPERSTELFPRRLALLLAGAFGFGVVCALIKGQSGDGLSLASQIRGEIGNLSTPWVLVAWFAGRRTRAIGGGALLGLVATLVALVGFYVVSGLVEPMGGSMPIADISSWLSANRVYFEAGVISGPVFGAFGAWSARRRSPSATLVAGLLLVGEPLVLLATGAIFPNGVLSPLTGLPLVVRIVPAFGLSGVGAASVAVHVAEVVVGLALIAFALHGRWRQTPAADVATDRR
jgi:hypothetical protein